MSHMVLIQKGSASVRLRVSVPIRQQGRPFQGPEAEGVLPPAVVQCSALCTGNHHKMQGLPPVFLWPAGAKGSAPRRVEGAVESWARVPAAGGLWQSLAVNVPRTGCVEAIENNLCLGGADAQARAKAEAMDALQQELTVTG